MATEIYGQRSHRDHVLLRGQKETRFYDSDNTQYIGLKAASNVTANLTFTLPAADGTSGQALVTNASGVLSFASFLSASLASGSIFVGVSGTATAVDTAAQGDITASATGLNINAGAIVNADVNAAAAIAYSKLNLTGSIVNADVNASAAIAYSKLNLSGSIVNADINASAAIAYSKLNLSASIVNADIASAAAIAVNKLAALTASRAVASDASGFLTPSATTSTELGYLSGVTSAVQTQLDSKAKHFAATWANADGASKVVTHSLGTKDVIIQIYDMSDDSTIEVDSAVRTDTNTVTLTASQAPAVNWRVVVIGK